MVRAAADPRLSSSHISLYLALLYLHTGGTFEEPVSTNKENIMQIAKISARATYQKCINELDDYRYIRYVPSFNHFLTSLVYFIDE